MGNIKVKRFVVGIFWKNGPNVVAGDVVAVYLPR